MSRLSGRFQLGKATPVAAVADVGTGTTPLVDQSSAGKVITGNVGQRQLAQAGQVLCPGGGGGIGPLSSSSRLGSSMDARKRSWSASVISKVVFGASSHLVAARRRRSSSLVCTYSSVKSAPAVSAI